MVRAIPSKPSSSIHDQIHTILLNGQISRREHLELTSIALADPQMSEQERQQINRVFDYIQIGRLKLVD